MKKIILAILLLLFSSEAYSVTFDEYYPEDIKPSKNLTVRKGSYIKVVNLRGINTFTYDIGDECEFINTNDMFIDEYLVLPRNSKVYGVVEDIREPVQGTNSAIKIKINKIVTPYQDKTFYPKAHIYSKNNMYIGGEQTNPAYYKKSPHYIEGWGSGVLQLTPLNIYEFGKHTNIKPGTELYALLEEDLKIYER